MERFLRNNGPCLVMLAMFFVVFMVGQVWDWTADNEDRSKPGQSPQPFSKHLAFEPLAEATIENSEKADAPHSENGI
jgi:hypothetical protein